MIARVAAFADDYGLPLLLGHLPKGRLAVVVAASIRPHQHAALHALAEREGAKFLLQPKRGAAGYDEFVASLRAVAADFAIVNSYSMKLWPEVLALFPKGGVNVHGGLLPWYRGSNPVQWAMIRDEREAGVTLHVLSEEIDAGPVIAQEGVPIRFTDTWVDVQARIAKATDALLEAQLPAVLSGTANAVAQDETQARTYPRRRPSDGRFDWSWTVLDIHNLVRALVHPHPGAFYETAAGPQVLDRYTTIAEIVALKFGPAGLGPIRNRGLVLSPVLNEASDVELAFAATRFAEQLGRVSIVDIDWQARTAGLKIAPPSTDLFQVLERFARTELGVRVT